MLHYLITLIGIVNIRSDDRKYPLFFPTVKVLENYKEALIKVLTYGGKKGDRINDYHLTFDKKGLYKAQ